MNKAVKTFYSTLQEASLAAIELRAVTARDYLKKRHLDPQLPSHPDSMYKSEWLDWRSFLGQSPKNFYSSLSEASLAVQALNIATCTEYNKKRHLDHRLPAAPYQYYEDDWMSWRAFLGRDTMRWYLTLAEASMAARELGIMTSDEYAAKRNYNSQLPSDPRRVYKSQWQGWPSFLGREVKKFYTTLSEASAAAKALGLNTYERYRSKRHLDPRLPAYPNKIYKKEWQGWTSFVDREVKRFYATLAEASVAAIALGINTLKQYRSKRCLDPKLPACPNEVYKKQWQGWPSFFGQEIKELYVTLAEASCASIALGINTYEQYLSKRHLDPRLPANPREVYKKQWRGWPFFVGRETQRFHATLAEASAAAIELGINTSMQYRSKRHLDTKLPSRPENVYKKQWQGWRSFFGREVIEPYATLAEASSASIVLGINTQVQYHSKRHLDPKLPSRPGKIYKRQWQGWRSFFGREVIEPYATLAEASAAAIALGVNTLKQYRSNRYLDPRLPMNPARTYKNQWQSWSLFWGNEAKNFYSKLAEASDAARALGCRTLIEYRSKRHLDLRLPSRLAYVYEREWEGWERFILPKCFENLNDVKFAVEVLNVIDSSDYRKKRKLHPLLPAHPDRKFKDEWVDWYDLCDIPRPYSYHESVALIAPERLLSKREYIDFIAKSEDPRLPRTPDKVYKDQWINWYVYLGTREPYRIKNIRSPYTKWAELIREFLKAARGGGTKESHLCRFVRYYIQAHNMGESPQLFLTLEKKDIRPFKDWLEANESKGLAYKTLTSVNEFLDFVIFDYLTDEDDETGELVLVPNAYNPFSNLSVDNRYQSSSKPGESVKHALAFQYVEAAKQWIVPLGSKTFSDLQHLHKFGADWFDIDPNKVDLSDPNCVVREHDGKCQIWFPVFWVHTYALMSVPARGRQIAYCDSGEADSLIPVIADSDSFEWQANTSSLSGQTNNQGFIKHHENGELGMYFTSNKTSFNGDGYSVAWMPDDLAKWIILLRNWQAKYNTISRPMPWLECVRTSLNEKQRIAKGANCFLFRDFSGEEPGHFSGRLAQRLSAALYNSQPQDLELATLSGPDKTMLSRYSSRYTPHSMRVSLITAYVEEFGLPLPIIMKVAGHSSVVMTIYYCKIGSEDLRRRFSEGEKRAMQNKSYAAQRMIEQGRIDEIKNELIATSGDALNLISNETPAGTYLFRDYGICPYGGDRCSDGGDIIQSSQVRSPAPVGYLGRQNCIACRHFITGPAFIGGLLSLGNEISLASHLQYEQYHELEMQLKETNRQLNEYDDVAYDAEFRGESLDLEARNNLELQKRKTLSEIEAAAKKLDVLLCDMSKSSKLLKQCQALVNQEIESSDEENKDTQTKLIVQKGHELQVSYDDVSQFNQLSEVCENAEIYQSASSEMALAPRSQLIDKMALRNGVHMHMFTLDKKQQLAIGNQVTRLMLDRLKSWEKVDALIDGRLCLEDLSSDERITKQELSLMVNPGQELVGNSAEAELEGALI